MNLKITSTALLLSAMFILSSCLKGDDDVDYSSYDAAAIYSVTLGTLNRYYNVKSSQGTDSLVKRTVTGSTYAINVDNINDTIYNQNLLPYGTDLSHVLVTFSTMQSSIVTLKSLTSDSIRTISSSDSLDFSKPRDLYVYSYNGENRRHYKMALKAYTSDPDSFVWKSVGVESKFQPFTNVRSFLSGNNIYALVSDDASATLYFAVKGVETLEWNPVTLPASLSASSQAVGADGKVYVFDAAVSKLYILDNGTVSSINVTNVKSLIAATYNRLYVIDTNGGISSSVDNGVTWISEKLDSDASLLPTQDFSSITNTLVIDENLSRLTVVGNRNVSTDNSAVVWTKLIDSTLEYSKQEPFIYQGFDVYNDYKLPQLKNLSVTSYNGKLYAIGGNGLGASTESPYSRIYESSDHGVTWMNNTSISLPEELDLSTPSSLVSDGKYLWIISCGNGQSWRGLLNKMEYSTGQSVFTK